MTVQLKEKSHHSKPATAGPSADDRFGAGPIATNAEARIIKGDIVGGRTRITIARGAIHGVREGMEGHITSGGQTISTFQIHQVKAGVSYAFTDATIDRLGANAMAVINPTRSHAPPTHELRSRVIHVTTDGAVARIAIARGSDHGIHRGMRGTLVSDAGVEKYELTIDFVDGNRSHATVNTTVDEVNKYHNVILRPLHAKHAAAIQRRATGNASTADVQATADAGVASASSRLPHFDTIQRAFGKHDISNIQSQVGGAATPAAASLGAQAYATGNRVAFASSPDLHTAAHEAAHTIQQRHGAVGFQGLGAADDEHEHHADAVADAVVAGQSAEPLLDKLVGGSPTTAIQRKPDESDKLAKPRHRADIGVLNRDERNQSAPKKVPTADDVIHAQKPEVKNVSSGTLASIAIDYTNGIFKGLDGALKRAIAALDEPPPPPEPSFALKAIGLLAQVLAGAVLGRIGGAVVESLKQGREPVSDATLNVIRDQFRTVTTAVSGGAKDVGSMVPGSTKNVPKDGVAERANPSAKTLLDEFAARAEKELQSSETRAAAQLRETAERVGAADQADMAKLVEALDERLADSQLDAWYQTQVAVGWMNLCASLSVGQTDPDKTAMPNANQIGGSVSLDWQRPHIGFCDIHFDVPEELNGLAGIQLASASVTSTGPGAARILRTTKSSLGSLPMFRRIWLGPDRFSQKPEFVITPENQLEVNTNSTLLAAIATGRRGNAHDLLYQGVHDEKVRARLEARAHINLQKPTNEREPGPLGDVLAQHPMGRLSPDEIQQFAVMQATSVRRAQDAQSGAHRVMMLLFKFGCDRIMEK